MVLTIPSHKMFFFVTKPHIKEYGRGYVRQPRFFPRPAEPQRRGRRGEILK
jgi:hypothetical protein